jgi:hypothetical protein
LGFGNFVMIFSIDFGSAVAKVLVVREDNSFDVVEVPLGFRTRPRLTIPGTLSYVIDQTHQELKLSEQPEAVYASGEIASLELKEFLTAPPLDPIKALKGFDLPIVIVGSEITHLSGEAVRGAVVAAAAEKIAHWLPFEVKISEIQNYFANKRLYPSIIPTNEREVWLEEAAARVRIKEAMGNGQWALDGEYIIASGGVFSKAPSISSVILMLLDSLEPQGVFKIYLDQKQMLPALATLAAFEEERAQEILDQEPFTFLGTTFSVNGEISLQIDVGLSEPQELEVPAGEVVVFPLDQGKTAKVRFRGPGGEGEFEASGGPAGLIIDTRGRPLEIPRNEGERIAVLKKWEEAVCRHQLFKK